jgi:hypothetical protein
MTVGGGNRNANNLPVGPNGRPWSYGLCSCCSDSGGATTCTFLSPVILLAYSVLINVHGQVLLPPSYRALFSVKQNVVKTTLPIRELLTLRDVISSRATAVFGISSLTSTVDGYSRYVLFTAALRSWPTYSARRRSAVKCVKGTILKAMAARTAWRPTSACLASLLKKAER